MNYIKRTGWQVGNNFFNNKWDAIQFATANPQHPYNAYCCDNTWDDADWTVEPKEDIKELEKKHAEHLRNKYKTLALFFSGGVDSSTVLDIFIRHKIPLDYICVLYVPDRESASYNKDAHLAMKYLEENKDKLMGAKIIYGSKPDHLEGNSIYNFKNNIHDVNWELRFHHVGHSENLKFIDPDAYRDVIENGCIVTGSNKPYVYKDEKGFYVQYVDWDDENWGQRHHEMFWQGEDPTLQIKQCHLAKQWLIENNLSNANEVYKSSDTDKFWSLNQRFGRMSIDEFFHRKHCFSDIIEDKYFSQTYGRNWGNMHYADYFDTWQQTESYKNLVLELDKMDKKFIDNYHSLGWITKKRYLE